MDWIKDEKRYKTISEMPIPEHKRKRLKIPNYAKLDEALITLFTQARSECMSISGPIIQ